MNTPTRINRADIAVIKGILTDWGDAFEVRLEKKMEMLIDTKLDARFLEFGIMIDAKLDAKLYARFEEFGIMVDAKFDAKLNTRFDELAFMVAKGFEDTNGRIDDLKNHMTYRFDSIERRIDDLAMTRVKYEHHYALEKRVHRLEHKLS